MGKDNIKREKMDFKTWLDNFWYYHKTKTILIMVFAIGLTLVLLNFDDIGASDYTVAIISNQTISEDGFVGLQKKVYEHGADYTGDSFVGVTVKKVGTDGTYVDLSSSEELDAILKDGEVYLFFLDDESYEYLKDKVDFCPLNEIITDMDLSGDRWYVKDSEFAASYDINENIPDDLSVSILKYESQDENDEKATLSRYNQILLARMILNVVVQTYNY